MIKYRIWDNKFSRFRYDTDGLQEEDDAGETIGWYETCGEDADIFLNLLKEIQEDDRWILQQWTGLKDKKGLDIYEGDIVLDFKEWRLLTIKKDEVLVRFFGKNFYFDSTMTEPYISKFDLENNNDRYRIIGTIFGLNEMPCKPDHNGECLICDCSLSECHLHEHLNGTVIYKDMEDYLFKQAVKFIKKHPNIEI